MRERVIRAGTRVRAKVPTLLGTKGVGTLMNDVFPDDIAHVMMDAGDTTFMGHELAVLRDQSPGPVPMRHRLPYGMWTCVDGREVLFDRDYRPIWTRRPGRPARAAGPGDGVDRCKVETFWTDSTAPWINRGSLARAEAILAEWVA